LSAEQGVLQARGDQVWVASVREQDKAPYRCAVEQSVERLSWWNPVDPDDLDRHLPLQSRDYRTFLIHAVSPEGDHDIVGKVNVVNAVRGRFESAAMGYDAYDPYAGRGLFAEGLRLVVNLAFGPQDAGGMGLHRVAATVQPGNLRSAGLLRSLGFQREGFSPRMLWLPDADGASAWRDHCSYVMLRDEWPSQPYRTNPGRHVVVLVNGVAGSRAPTLARQLAVELGIPLFSRNAVARLGWDALWTLLADSPVGGVVESRFQPDDAVSVAKGLRRSGLDPATIPEVCCFPPGVGAAPRPLGLGLGLGPTVAVDTDDSVGPAEVVRIALQVGAGGYQHPRHNNELLDQ